jgi:quercetin dioxygenase-like cupin family protein
MLKFERIHEDKRGEIYLITEALPQNREITLFITYRGFARGGCIHTKSGEHCTVIEGKIKYYVKGKKAEIYSKGESLYTPKNTPHYFVAITPKTIVIEWGPFPEEKKQKHPEWRKYVDKINMEKRK